MMTLMPVAAFAGVGVADTPEADMSYFVADGGNQTVTLKKAKDGIDFSAVIQDTDEEPTTASVYVWAKDANGTVSSALEVVGGSQNNVNIDGVWNIANVKDGATYTLKFNRAGEYTVYAGLAKKSAAGNVDSLSKINVFADASTIKVTGASVDPDTYVATINGVDGDKTLTNEETRLTADSEKYLGTITLTPNNVESDKYTVVFEEAVDTKNNVYRDLRSETVAISTNSASIEVNKETATTNSRGAVDFTVSASVEGTYEIDLEVNGVSWTIEVVVGNTSASYIELANQPKAPKAQFSDLGKAVRFTITDINGNIVKGATNGNVISNKGMNGIKFNADKNGKYVVLTEKPAASNLESEDLGLKYDAEKLQWYLTGVSTMDAEGTYTVKAILDNGAYATATWEVKKFQKPVELRVDYATTTVELGGKITPEQVVYVDENKVEKAAKDAKFAATGYAVQNLSDEKTITVKTDEKYVGAKITVTAVSEKYDLIDTVELTVAEGASEIAFVDKTAEVNVNNRLVWNVVDASGNKVALGEKVKKLDVKYVVLDKPEGAKVSTNDVTNAYDLKTKGEGKLALTSNKIGNVAVQVILKAEYAVDAANADAEKVQVKYYTGTQIFAVGNGSVGDVVVMSIGSSEIIVNDAKATIDAAPMIQNDRTYVPFRALAEAFGAEVAYDEATQAVTAELNGVKVVMTIGSATYTVNDAEKTMDVAPFINGSRTMVPVRFVAEAFGIKVIPTYDENGATADILFNL